MNRTTTTLGTTSTAAAPIPGMRKTLFGIGAGNAVEWFDWAIYATFASYIARVLFSPGDRSSAFMATLAIFAVGFVARPVGGFVFGLIGDKVGRKASMTMAVGLAASGSMLIALTPSYDSIGSLASVMLLAARLLQGLAHGGELPSAQTYLAEVAPREQRGLYSTLIYFSGTAGIVLGTLMGAVMTLLLHEEAMLAFGWRIPFAVGGLFGLYTLIMRSRLSETEQFTEQKSASAPQSPAPSLWRDFLANKAKALQVIGLTVGLTVVYYIWSVATPAHAISNLGMDPAQALWIGVAANLVFMAALPAWGKLSDRIGRRPVLLIALLGAALMQFPMGWLVQGEWWQLLVAMTTMLLFISASSAIMPAVYAELFPTSVRTIGVAVPYAICVALFGGSAAYLQAGFDVWFGNQGSTFFSVYSVVLLLVSACTAWGIAETRGKDLSR